MNDEEAICILLPMARRAIPDATEVEVRSWVSKAGMNAGEEKDSHYVRNMLGHISLIKGCDGKLADTIPFERKKQTVRQRVLQAKEERGDCM
jgi:hypothetical protein